MATTPNKPLRDRNESSLHISAEEFVKHPKEKSNSPLRIAIIGSGVSGLAALWSLKTTSHEVHLYESQDYFGGHTQTVEWKNLHGQGTTNVDIAFMLFNRLTYPNFTAFVNHLKLAVRSLRVTFGVSRDNDNFEWSSRSLFAQRRNLFSPTFYRMLFDILRFNQFSPLVLSPSYPHKADTISDYLARNQYSSTFANDYLIPLASSLWIHDQDDTLNGIPIVMLVQYLYNHRILDTFGRSLEWLVLEGGAKRYVDAILEGIPAKWLHKSTPVKSLSSTEGVKLSVVLENGKVEIFDRVIMATHAPDALSILGDATPEERAILGKFRTSESTMVLHSDISFMPRNRNAWPAWNYHDFPPSSSPSSSTSSPPRVSLTFNLNSHPTQNPAITGPILSTLNPHPLPSPSTVQGIFSYKHPIFDHEAQTAQSQMEQLQGDRGIWFAGAWLGYGFHEDGFRSGVEAARGVENGAELPFTVVDWKDSGEGEEGRGWRRIILGMLIAGAQRVILVWCRVFGAVFG